MSAAVFGTLVGCMGCMVCVESLAKEQPAAMNLMTFSTFLFIAVEGLIFTSSGYVPVVLTFFLCNVINNQALNFHVPVPLHIIFRSGSLLTSLIMNKLLLNRQYSIKKYASVLAITLGIIICTLATANVENADESSLSLEEAQKHYHEWVIGIMMLTVALLISSFLAICQERMYTSYGKHPREAMFYIHGISLPFFALMGADIWKSALKFNAGPPLQVFGTLVLPSVSGLWLKLFGACFMQWLCITFVYRLNAEMDSLSVTLVVTLRKFLSLLVSIFWFQNPFTAYHWLGTALVFGGTLVFSDVIGGGRTTNKPKKN